MLVRIVCGAMFPRAVKGGIGLDGQAARRLSGVHGEVERSFETGHDRANTRLHLAPLALELAVGGVMSRHPEGAAV